MPTYEYQCRTCGHHFEKMQRFSESPLTECPKCGGEVRRVIHPAGVIFKGSGWYITDSRKGSGGDGDGKSEGGKDKATSAASSEGGKAEGGKAEGGKAADKTAAGSED